MSENDDAQAKALMALMALAVPRAFDEVEHKLSAASLALRGLTPDTLEKIAKLALEAMAEEAMAEAGELSAAEKGKGRAFAAVCTAAAAYQNACNDYADAMVELMAEQKAKKK